MIRMVKIIMIKYAEIAYKQNDNEPQHALNMDYEEYKKLKQILERLDKCDIFMKSFIWKETKNI